MRNVEEAPGIFRVEMSDEERRRKFTVPREVARVVGGEDLMRSLPGVVRVFYDEPFESKAHNGAGSKGRKNLQRDRSQQR